MMAECAFDKDVAVVATAALAEDVNAKFGDSLSPRTLAAETGKFIQSGIDLKCRYCGWKKPNSSFCTQRCHDVSPTNTCELFRHVHCVEE
jgi:hypothetical protein